MSAEYVEFKEFKVLIHRKPHIRQSRLKISPKGEIEIIAPLKAKDNWIEDFLKASEPWIHKTLQRFQEFKNKNPDKKYVQGESFYFLGRPLPLDFRKSFANTLKIIPTADSLIIMVPQTKWHSGMLMTPQPWLKNEIKKFFKISFSKIAGERTQQWAQHMGLKPTAVGFRFQKTLWGSCNREGNLSLNCKLIGAPIEAIDYVIIHELSHLKFMNHSRAFWELVKRYSPNQLEHRKWLRTHALKLEP